MASNRKGMTWMTSTRGTGTDSGPDRTAVSGRRSSRIRKGVSRQPAPDRDAAVRTRFSAVRSGRRHRGRRQLFGHLRHHPLPEYGLH